MNRILSLAIAAMPMLAVAQTEGPAFNHSGKGVSLTFATDYQCVGINPANLGWKPKYADKKVTFGIGGLATSLTTSAFDKQGLKDDFIGSLKGDVADFNYAGKVDASKKFTDAPLAYNIDVQLFGISLHTDSAGSFAFSMRDRIQWYSSFNKQVSEIMFQGFWAPYFDYLVLGDANGNFIDTIPNDANVTQAQRDSTVRGLNSNGQKVSKIMDGSAYDMLWYREYGFSWGNRIMHNDKMELYGGVGVKYLAGIGMIDISADGGDLTAQSSLSPYFDIDYGENAKKNPSTVTGDSKYPFPKSVGHGWAVDLGLSALINEKLKIGLSYTDLGSITWDGNVYVAADSIVDALDENGFDNYNFFDQADNFTSDVGIYKWEGQPDVKVKLPSTLRTGVGYIISEKAEVGFEAVIPMNDEPGAYRKAVIALGGEVRPTPWLGLNLGMTTGGNYPLRIPFGLTFSTPDGGWEAGFSTRDLKTMIAGGDEPTMSYCFGLLRFRI